MALTLWLRDEEDFRPFRGVLDAASCTTVSRTGRMPQTPFQRISAVVSPSFGRRLPRTAQPELRILRTRPPIGGFLGRMHDVPGTRTWCGLVPASGASRDPDCPGAPIDSSPAASQDRSPGEDLHEAHPWRHVGELSGQGDFRRCMTGACATFRRRRVRARPTGRGEPRRSRGSGPQAQRNSAPPGQDASTGPPDGLRRRHGTVPH